MAVGIGKVDRVRLLMIDDGVGVNRVALMILQLQRGKPLEERDESACINRERDAMKARSSRAPCGWPVNNASSVVTASLEIISGPLGVSAQWRHSSTMSRPSARLYHDAASYQSGTKTST